MVPPLSPFCPQGRAEERVGGVTPSDVYSLGAPLSVLWVFDPYFHTDSIRSARLTDL